MRDGESSACPEGEYGEKLSPGERLMAASGLHFMTANLEQVLSATFYKSFEIPLLDVYDTYRQQLADRQTTYEAEVSAKTRAIRETELRNLRQGAAGKGRNQRFLGRDLDSFRKGLKELQDQVEAVEKVKQVYYLEVAGGEFEVWKSVADNISLVVKSEVEVYDRVASKATSDPTLEMMVASIPDPFDTYKETVPNSSQAPEIYSILPPLSSILTPAQVIARKSMAELAQPPFFPVAPSTIGTTSYPSSSLNDQPSLDSSTHWSTEPTAPLDVPSLSIAHYQSDDPELGFRSAPSALFHSPPALPCPDDDDNDDNDNDNDNDTPTPRPIPPIAIGVPAVPFQTALVKAPTPLRNVISLASTSTSSSAPTITVDQKNPDPKPHSTKDPTNLLSAIRCPLASTKRASMNTLGSSGLLSVLEVGHEESLMCQLPPNGLDSDSELDGP
ncbi:hypothetical protein CROQUDRAFT_37855 [Cronartium quercuum f. sp. fusiforme G11]|uniref:Uncharacterized protein n=1 Tax=Cronartium quercuum f. sp. fusiforme G11 TaxID=708437 RepID=A0A9P6NV77_9BASI|nr:hypothetical protein CROQUDRAFT_37855 [Cronartium quercuum f. sp. fusiforme G11]